MLGNVEEWTWDRIWSTASSFNGVEGGLDPVRRGAGGGRVLRGGSWREQEPAQLRAAARSALVAGDPRTADDRGFRLVRTAAPPD
jgi:formylglycine-generating enzyme required for sulfatase activity